MRKALNMKLLILILTALAALSAVVVDHEIHVAQETRRANIAEKFQNDREQIRKDDAEYREQQQIQKASRGIEQEEPRLRRQRCEDLDQ
jgi:ribulose kinase